MTEYNGATSLQKALEQLHGKKLTNDGLSKITNKYRERLNIETGQPIRQPADKLKIYQWERDAITQSSLTELQPPIESSIEPLPTDSNITQLENDIVPTVEPVIELDIIRTQNDSKPCDTTPSNQIDALTEWNGKKPTPPEFAKTLGYKTADIFNDVLFVAGFGDAPFKSLATPEKRRVIECFALEYPLYKQSIKMLTEKQTTKLIASNRAAIENLMKRHQKKVADNAAAPKTNQPDVLLLNELNATQSLNTIEPVIELDLIRTQSDSKLCDKFISINYRHADNSRHTVQIEQFFIDALIAIGITDISKFVAENAGVTTVTKNVKRSIVNELVKRGIEQTSV